MTSLNIISQKHSQYVCCSLISMGIRKNYSSRNLYRNQWQRIFKYICVLLKI